MNFDFISHSWFGVGIYKAKDGGYDIGVPSIVRTDSNRLSSHLKSGVPVMFISSDRKENNSDEKQRALKTNLRRKLLTDDILNEDLSLVTMVAVWEDIAKSEMDSECAFFVEGYKNIPVRNHNTPIDAYDAFYKFDNVNDRLDNFVNVIDDKRVVDFDEFTNLAKKWCVKHKQKSTIVGKFNEDTNLYDFVMYNYTYNTDGSGELISTTNFNDVKFADIDDVENFYRKYIVYNEKLELVSKLKNCDLEISGLIDAFEEKISNMGIFSSAIDKKNIDGMKLKL